MTITLVLPQPPGYSETFFQSKIKGLEESGHEIIIASASTKVKYNDFKLVQHPKVVKNVIEQLCRMILVFMTLLPYYRRVLKYIQLEKKEKTNTKRIIEKLYLNAALLKLNTDWLHFGFASITKDRELVAKAINAKMGISLRGFDIGVYPLKHPNCYNKLWKYVDKIQYNSYDLYEKALKLGLSKQVQAHRITPAINTNLFHSSKVKTQPSKPVFITIGRLHWKKGYVLMLEALSELDKKGIDFEYRIIGDGNDRQRIAYTAHQLNIRDKVIFLGKLSRNEVKSNLELADYCLQYSMQEGFCNAALEAQAMGKLCLVSDAEGLAENVLHAHTGWVVPKYQPRLLAQKIMQVMQLPNDDIITIQTNAQNRAKKEFDLEHQKRLWNEFFKEI